jgi:hypothetical protein
MWQLISNIWPLIAILYGPVVVGLVLHLLWNRLSLLRPKRKVEDVFEEAKSETFGYSDFGPRQVRSRCPMDKIGLYAPQKVK